MSGEASLRYKLNKKLKLAIGRSKNNKDGYKKVESTLNNDRKGKFKPMNSDRRKKRIYAEQDMVGEVASSYNERAPSRKAFSKKGQNRVKGDFDTAKGNKNSHRTMWVSKRLEDATSETKCSFREVKDRVESASASYRTRTKDVDKVDVGWAGSLKKTTKSKYDSSKRLDISHKKYSDLPPSKSAKKNVQEKRRLDDDTEVLDDKPKKSKRVIRIDRNDISNKRLDDGVVINGQYLSCYYLHFLLQLSK